MSELKLLNCPFCGGEAKIVRYCSKKTIVYVECTKCLAYMGNQRIITSSSRGKEYFESEEKLINAWNRRKPMANIVEKLEEESKKKHNKERDVLCKIANASYSAGVEYAINIVKQEINNGLE